MPAPFDPALARQFAVEVVQKLRGAGYEALWAGGCVRDQLLGLAPKDYDVATAAAPDEVRRIFGHKRTLAIGASFGVITVLGPPGAGQIEVATFRRDAGYSDGRHPDSVTFSSAEEDAQRRDFTINGLFFDPIAERVIDYVGGVADLEQHIIRAIGDPHARFAEDKLRMLRAVRFAATFGFSLDAETLVAIHEHAHELVIVSAERIAAELRRMLTHPGRFDAAIKLMVTGLLEVILPEARGNDDAIGLELLAAQEIAFPTALALLLRRLPLPDHHRSLAHIVGERWKLANDEIELADWLLANEPLARHAHTAPWPAVQRMLIQPGAGELLRYLRAIVTAERAATDAVDFIAARLALPPHELNPPPLITGADLKLLGLAPGPRFKTILEEVRDAQLLGRLHSSAEALDYVRATLL